MTSPTESTTPKKTDTTRAPIDNSTAAVSKTLQGVVAAIVVSIVSAFGITVEPWMAIAIATALIVAAGHFGSAARESGFVNPELHEMGSGRRLFSTFAAKFLG